MSPGSPSDNRAKAPVCAAFVEGMREVFGDVKVLYVAEGAVQLGEEDSRPRATCFVLEKRRK